MKTATLKMPTLKKSTDKEWRDFFEKKLNATQSELMDCLRILNQLYLYANVCHPRPADYKEVIEGLLKKHPWMKTHVSGVL